MYPRKGISQLYEAMASRVRATGNAVLLNAPVIRLERTAHHIARVVYRQDGREHAIDCRAVVSTLPLHALASMITPALPDELLAHAAKLRYRSMRLIYVTLNRDRLTDFHWVYLSDRKFRCNRVSEQKNVSADMGPPGQTVLCVELSCWKDEPLWRASDEEVFQIAMRDLKQTGLGVTDEEVSGYFVCNLETAYPVYELNFETHLLPVLDGVHALDNVATVGRHGLFLNNSMDDNVLLGMKVADQLASGAFDSRRWHDEMVAFMNLRFQGK
jgi:protoporphyrinogen oxidase